MKNGAISPDMFSFKKSLKISPSARGFPLGRSERHATIAIWFQWMSGSDGYQREISVMISGASNLQGKYLLKRYLVGGF